MMNDPEELNEPASDYALDLPIAPPWFSKPPQGTIEDGIALSLEALEQVKNRPEVFAERDRCRCDVEFIL
jgi:hypothetical protein